MSLIAWYKLDGNAQDSSGNGFHGSPSNVSWVDGKIGRCASFNGINSIINFGNGNTFFPLPAFSISIWFKSYGTTPDTGTSPGLFGFTYGIRCRVLANKLYWGVDNGSATTYLSSPSTYNFYTDNAWHHAVFTVSPTQRKMYIDGELVGIRNDTWIGQTRWPTNSWNIGRDNNNSMYFFKGLMDDFSLYSHILSLKEVKDLSKAKILHYKFDSENSILDSSGYENHATNITAPLWTTNSKIGTGCYSFEKNQRFSSGIPVTSEYFAHPQSLYTISAWVKLLENPTGDSVLIGGAYYSGFALAVNSSGGIRGYYRTSAAQRGTNSYTLPLNQWVHTVLVLNRVSLQMILYINGQSYSSVSIDNAAFGYESMIFKINWVQATGGSGFDSCKCQLDDIRLYATALSADDILSLFRSRASIDSQGNFHSAIFNEIHHRPLLLDYTVWENGQTGSVAGFTQNGSTSENYRILGTDPWGKETVLWEARPDATSGPDGGWNTNNFTIDRTKFYRFSVWVYRTVQGNGFFYLGTNGYGSTNGVYNRSNGANNTNPYFISGSITPAQGWQLVVGHIWPEGSGTGANHKDSGRYNIDGKFANISTDFVWRAETTSARHRSYLYYSTDTTTRQRWVYPRVDLCDGTEPSINELLSGFDSRNIDLIRAKGGINKISLDVSDRMTNTGLINETGPVDGLVAWWPLDGNTDDISGSGNHGTLSGNPTWINRFSNMAISCTASADRILLLNTIDNPMITVSFWHKYEGATSWATLVGSVGNIHPAICQYGVNLGIWDGSFRSFNYNVNDGYWHHYVIIYNSGINAQLYVDSIYKTQITIVLNLSASPINCIGNSSNYSYPGGSVGDVRIYNKALTPKEINILYSLTGNSETKSKLTSDTLYLSGQIKEI